MREVSDPRVVGDDDHGPSAFMQAPEQAHDPRASRGIQAPRRLVGEQDGRLRHECPGDRDALLLPAGKLVRPMGRSRSEAHGLECSQRLPLPVAIPAVGEGQRDVVDGSRPCEQVPLLEDETHEPIADLGQRIVTQPRHVDPGEHVLATIRHVEAAEDVHERALARTRRSDDGDELASFDPQVDPTQGVHRGRSGGAERLVGRPVALDDPAHRDERRVHVRYRRVSRHRSRLLPPGSRRGGSLRRSGSSWWSGATPRPSRRHSGRTGSGSASRS